VRHEPGVKAWGGHVAAGGGATFAGFLAAPEAGAYVADFGLPSRGRHCPFDRKKTAMTIRQEDYCVNS
jgi:hypothetical protein